MRQNIVNKDFPIGIGKYWYWFSEGAGEGPSSAFQF